MDEDSNATLVFCTWGSVSRASVSAVDVSEEDRLLFSRGRGPAVLLEVPRDVVAVGSLPRTVAYALIAAAWRPIASAPVASRISCSAVAVRSFTQRLQAAWAVVLRLLTPIMSIVVEVGTQSSSRVIDFTGYRPVAFAQPM